MCVIAIKPVSAALPDNRRLQDMFISNPDGAGYMFVRNNKVIIHKGFMKFEELLSSIKKDKLTQNDLVAFHFRISTSGKVEPGQTHPFPISNNLDNLLNTSIETDIGIAHNGIMPIKDKTDQVSDTIVFIQEILSQDAVKNSIFNFGIISLVELSIGSSRLVFFTKDKRYTILGDWFYDKETSDGILYSNLYFKTRNEKQQYMCVITKNDVEVCGWKLSRKIIKRAKAIKYYSSFPTLGAAPEKTVYYPVKDDEKNDEPIDTKDKKVNDKISFITHNTKHCPECGFTIDSPNQFWCMKCGSWFEITDG